MLTGVYGVGAALLLFASALPALGAAAVAFALVDGRRSAIGNGAVFQLVGLRYRERIGIADRDRRRGRRARRLLPADDPRHRARRLRLLRARASARSPRGRGRPGGTLVVRADLDRPGRSAGMRTLVVGGGIAGQAVLEAVREQDPTHELTLVCAEPRLPVRPRRALDAAGERRRPGDAHAAPASWYEDQRIEVARSSDAGVETLDTDALRPRRPVHRLATRSSRRSPAPSTPTSSAAPRTARRSRPPRGQARRRDRRRPARARGRLRAGRARLRGDGRAPHGPPDGAPARRRRRARCSRPRWRRSASRSCSSATREEITPTTASGSPAARSSTADLVVISVGIRPQTALARACRPRRRPRDRRRRRAA